ncbi:MAG: class I SAM-dependent methyltransferase [Hyphomicrobiaceae bacterium]|nr:MAG: class I SAM-dependent methyltransferase [Hyphomicrobiaceae bacterium]
MLDKAHASHLDGIYRHQRFFYDLTREYYLLGRNKLIADLAPPAGGSILEIGCGTARNLIKAAQAYPQARCFGFDLSSVMLRTGQASVRRHGLQTRICLRYADATCFDAADLFGIDRFDRIFISYALSMIPHWQAALRRAAGRLAPGGSLHVVDFGSCEALPALFRQGLYAWLWKFSVQPRATLGPALEAVAREYGGRLDFRSLFRGYASYAVLTLP